MLTKRLRFDLLQFSDRGVILKASAIAYSRPKSKLSWGQMAQQTIRFEIKDPGVGIASD